MIIPKAFQNLFKFNESVETFTHDDSYGCVYCVSFGEKCYIGSTNNIYGRLAQYKAALVTGTRSEDKAVRSLVAAWTHF